MRKISRTVSTYFKIDVNYATIYRWIARYVPLISEYVNSLAPNISGKLWHADEPFVRVKGGKGHGKVLEWIGYVWNIMDRETRFLIVSKLTTTRTVFDTVAALKK